MIFRLLACDCNIKLCKLLIILSKHTTIYHSVRSGPVRSLGSSTDCPPEPHWAHQLYDCQQDGRTPAVNMTVKIEDRNKNTIKRNFDQTWSEEEKITGEISPTPKLKKKKVSKCY